ncbi:MAG: hypothetical protein JXX28_16870 [Deltaproteobacteria bacterium]|nr:hypothetical protein [Deltaproteobacteria bacterium]
MHDPNTAPFLEPPILPVLAETEDWVVVAKPSRLMVHRSEERVPDKYFALQLVRDQVGCRVHPVHRLDRGTSGTLLFAKNPEWARRLQAALSAPDAGKTYLALVRGAFKQVGSVEIQQPMKDDRGVLREASSTVRALGVSTDPRCSLLEVRPRTGRYHQVRRHVRDLTHPVIGDSVHGDTKFNRLFRDAWGLDRLGLHALRLDLPLDNGERISAVSPLPPELASLFRRMPWWEAAVTLEPALALQWPLERAP